MLQELERISRDRPDRVLRLSGQMADGEALELVIFRGMSSSLTHPTAFDPDEPVLPAEARIDSAVLLQAPFNPAAEQRLCDSQPAQAFLDPALWA